MKDRAKRLVKSFRRVILELFRKSHYVFIFRPKLRKKLALAGVLLLSASWAGAATLPVDVEDRDTQEVAEFLHAEIRKGPGLSASNNWKGSTNTFIRVEATEFVGDGSGLTGLPAGTHSISSVTVADTGFVNLLVFGVCFASVTLTVSDGTCSINFTGTVANSAAGGTAALAFLEDGQFVDGFDSLKSAINTTAANTAAARNGSFSWPLSCSAGSHTWCLTMRIENVTGSVAILNNANHNNKFWIEQP